MMLYDTLTHILRDARDKAQEIRFIDGDKDESTLTFAELWNNAVDLLGALQKRGMEPGDELVIFTKSNRKFVVAFWAAVLGGIGSIPGAVLGSFILGLTEAFATGYVSSDYEDVFAFSLLVLILIFRPSGLLGKATIEKV